MDMKYLQYDLSYTDTTSFTIGYLPPNAYIKKISVIVPTSFEDGVLDIGDGTTANKFANDIDLNTTLEATVTATTSWGAVLDANEQTEIKGIIIATSTGLSVGSAKIVVEYCFNE